MIEIAVLFIFFFELLFAVSAVHANAGGGVVRAVLTKGLMVGEWAVQIAGVGELAKGECYCTSVVRLVCAGTSHSAAWWMEGYVELVKPQ